MNTYLQNEVNSHFKFMVFYIKISKILSFKKDFNIYFKMLTDLFIVLNILSIDLIIKDIKSIDNNLLQIEKGITELDD